MNGASADLPGSIELRPPGLILEPLQVGHAPEMVTVLADPAIYEFIGGEPPSLESLRTRYSAQVRGASTDGLEVWLNWVIRLVDTGEATGYVQATLADEDGAPTAEVAWVVAPRFQGRGIASRSTKAMCDWLRQRRIERILAHVHPGHAASEAVARSAGLTPTEIVIDGEVRWIG